MTLPRRLTVLLLFVAFLLLVSSVFAPAHGQTLPHDMPDYGTRPGCTVLNSGQSLTLTNQTFECLQVNAGARVWPTVGMNASIGTLQIHGGNVDLRTTQDGQPVRNVRINILSLAIDTAFDPEQFGTGILVVDGVFKVYGQEKTPFCRLAEEPQKGATTLKCTTVPEMWFSGDVLALPDTRVLPETERLPNGANYVSQSEEAVICGVNLTTITLCAPLVYTHPGSRNLDGVLEFLPHAANLSRTAMIRSDNPAMTRGHILATGRADVDIRYTWIYGMGRTKADPLHCTLRSSGAHQDPGICWPGTGSVTQIGTNQIGRYALHAHHLIGPAGLPVDVPQFRFEGNTLQDSRKWPIALHRSSYGLVKNNVMYRWTGSAFMSEDGWEFENVIEDNFALVGTGAGGGRDGLGREGVGFYFRGPGNIVRRNIAAAIQPTPGDADAAFGFKYYQKYLAGSPHGVIPKPSAKGASTFVDVEPFALPIREFSDNEAYGAMESGLTYWWIGTFGGRWTVSTTRSTIRNFRVWNTWSKGIFQYESFGIDLDGYVYRGPLAYDAQDYWADQARFSRLDLEGTAGVVMSTIATPAVIENSRFRNTQAIILRMLWTSANFADDLIPRLVTVRNATFLPTPTGSWRAIVMQYSDARDPAKNLVQRDEMIVESSNLGAFQAFYSQQAPGFVVPPTIYNADGSMRVVGASHGTAIAGRTAPCRTIRPDVDGFACALGGSEPPPPQPVDAVVSEWSAWTPTSEWSPCVNGTQSRTEERTRTVLTPASNGGTTPHLSETRTVSQACTVPLTMEVLAVTSRCAYQAMGKAPDATGGWKVQFKRDGQNHGTVDSSADADGWYTRSAELAFRSYTFTAVWMKSGRPNVTTAPTVVSTCRQ
jgi:hypothetical protein